MYVLNIIMNGLIWMVLTRIRSCSDSAVTDFYRHLIYDLGVTVPTQVTPTICCLMCVQQSSPRAHASAHYIQSVQATWHLWEDDDVYQSHPNTWYLSMRAKLLLCKIILWLLGNYQQLPTTHTIGLLRVKHDFLFFLARLTKSLLAIVHHMVKSNLKFQ